MAGLFATLTLNPMLLRFEWKLQCNIWSKLKIPLNGYFQLFFQVLIDIFLRKSIICWKKLLVVSKLAKSEGDTFLNALKGKQR